eukprot:g3536.t1
MSRQPLEGICKNNPTNTKVWVEISESVAAFVPYVLEIWSLQMPNQLAVIGNVWTLHLQRKIELADQTLPHGQEVAQCDHFRILPGHCQRLWWTSAMPPSAPRLCRRSLFSSERAGAQAAKTHDFGAVTLVRPEPTMGDFVLGIDGPVGASFPLDCSSSMVDLVANLASAALPGRFLSCVGRGGDSDRALARLSFQDQGFGGLVVGEIYGLTLQVMNRPFISGLSKHSNSWRISISDPLWYASEVKRLEHTSQAIDLSTFDQAISAGLPSYDMTEPAAIDFRVSSQRSTDPHSLVGPEKANVTLRFTLPESQDWVPDARASQTEQVFTGSCAPSCVFLAPETCDVGPETVAKVVMGLELEATISYCFAIECLSPEQSGLGLWTLEFRSSRGELQESTGHTAPDTSAARYDATSISLVLLQFHEGYGLVFRRLESIPEIQLCLERGAYACARWVWLMRLYFCD